jgi:predicted regulator of Ras-like GTPase activity (Roadblock/LC7/MglB family)
MHWFAEHVEELRTLSEQHARAKAARDRAVTPEGQDQEVRAREQFTRAVDDVVGRISERDGVTACFVSHDGLLAARRGDADDFEALAAVAQSCASTGRDAAKSLALGSLQQMLLIGEQHKLALIVLGQLVLGIVSPTTTQLQSVLAARGEDEATAAVNPADVHRWSSRT